MESSWKSQPLRCKCQCASSHLPANRHEDLWGKWGVTYGPTHARLPKLLLWCGELIGLQVGKQPLVPDVDCKYPAVVYTTHGGAGPSLRHLSFPFFMSFGRVFLFPASLDKYWEMYSKSLETDDDWLLGCICEPTCLCLRSGSWSMTPYVVWWRRMCKRNVLNGCRPLFEHVDCIENKTKMFICL